MTKRIATPVPMGYVGEHAGAMLQAVAVEMKNNLILLLIALVMTLTSCGESPPAKETVPVDLPKEKPPAPEEAVLADSLRGKLPAPKEAVLTKSLKEYWIGTNTNTLNLGTLAQPFDGSTRSNFDYLLPHIPGPCVIHLLPGVYWTWGSYADNQINPGVQLIGSGMTKTIVRVDTNAPPTTFAAMVILQCGYGYYSSNVISDLTVDGNYPGFMAVRKTNININGVLLNGTHQRISRVMTTNLMTCTNVPGSNPEGWSLTIGTGGALQVRACDDEVIEDCVVTRFYGSHQTDGIAFNSDWFTGAKISGIIRSNTIAGVIEAFNGAFMINSRIVGNHVFNCVDGLYGDTGSYSNLVVADNTFNGVVWGARFPCNGRTSYRRDNLTFTRNRFALQGDGAMIGIGTSGVGTEGPPFFNLTLNGNEVTSVVGATKNSRFMTVRDVKGLTIASNRISSSFLPNVIAGCSSVRISNNVDWAGTDIPLHDISAHK